MVLRPVVRVMPVAEVREERLLPAPGRVVVSQGKMVKASEVVAEAEPNPRYRLIDAAQALGVPRSKADKYIICQEEDIVHAGDTLAQKKGLLTKVVRAPVDGKVVLVADGQVLIEEYQEPYLLRAGLPAKVNKIIPDLGVELALTGMVIDGIWGNGRYNYGMLRTIATKPSSEITTKDLSVETRGLILVSGRLNDKKVLEIGESLPLRGLIVGTMRASLVPIALEVSYPVVVLDGFGNRPMNSRAFRLLSTSDGQRTAVFATPPSGHSRPAIIAPLPSTERHESPPKFDEVKVGSTVRILRAPYAGQIGQVIDLPPGFTQFPNGVKAPAAEVRLENKKTALVPLVNLEILVQS